MTARLLGEKSASLPLSYPRIARRLRLSDADLDLILAALLSQAEVVAGAVRLPGVTRDPKDDAIVACAVEGGADHIVSGDQDLLALGKFQGMEIITPRQFQEILVAASD